MKSRLVAPRPLAHCMPVGRVESMLPESSTGVCRTGSMLTGSMLTGSMLTGSMLTGSMGWL